MSAAPVAAADAKAEATLRRRGVLLVVAFFLIDGVMRAAYFHFGALAQGGTSRFAAALVAELTSSAAVVVLFFAVVVPTCRRFPLRGEGWPSRLPAHVGALVVYSVAKTLAMWGSRAVLWPLVGLGRYDYGDLSYRFPMEAASDVTAYILLAAGIHLWDGWRERREREVRQARLEARLSEARLAALQGQLQPHFLFNTLNTISSVLYDDPRRADDLIARLSDLLRASLDAPHRPEVSLEEELAILRGYVDLVTTRFEDRLTVTVDVDPAARGASVPVFLVQPLVENAVLHGVGPRAGPGSVAVTVAREGDDLRIDVADDGPGITGDPEAAVGRGIGLANTRERLAHLHGDRAALTLANEAGGGLRVTVRLPCRRASEEAGGG